MGSELVGREGGLSEKFGFFGLGLVLEVRS
jgi:hypothetical protein